MATQYAAPFSGSTIPSALRYRQRHRPSIPDSVDADYGSSALSVVASGGGASVDVSNGFAHVQGHVYELSVGPHTETVPSNAGASDRYDILVLRYDAAATPGIRIFLIVGTAGQGLPALTQVADGIWDFPLADWAKTPAGAITNMRDRRFFHDGVGGLIGPDTAPKPNKARYGAQLLTMPGAKEWRWVGSPYNFWERVDPGPLLRVGSADGGNVTSTSFSSSAVGAPTISGKFIAPLSGRVWVTLQAQLGSPTAKPIWVGCHITGPDNFSHLGNPDDNNLTIIGAEYASGSEFGVTSIRYPVEGLTPGSSYTATIKHAVPEGNSGSWVDQRAVSIERG